MKVFLVHRYGKCVECGKVEKTELGEFEGLTSQDAVEKAQELWLYERFGEGGALRDFEKPIEESFLDAQFPTEYIRDI